ncbi:MAG: hypothetical protein QHJ34_08845 [bacterium]|jgi:hypothetical protein|nr:hypothetical protein [candidate division KSB1 bacterium]MDH7560321.1 hypothetical protein [bacterium]
MERTKAICFLTGLALFVLAEAAMSQVRVPLFKIHDRGDLWETMKDNGQIGGLFSPFEYYPSMDWPGGPAVLPNKDEQRSYSQGGGVWIGGKKAGGTVFFNEMGPFDFVDLGTFYLMEEVENFNGSRGFNPHEAEEKITARWRTSDGIQVTRISRAWSYPAYADFIIIEYLFVNASGQVLSEVYFGFPYLLRPSYQDILVHGFWGDNLNVDDEMVGYDAARRLLYAYDYYPTQDIKWDWGNYWEKRGELRTTGYAGFAPLYWDPPSNGAEQPATVFWAQVINNAHRLTITSRTASDLYAILNGTDKSLQAPANEQLSPFMLQGFGPYDMAIGDTVRIVMVEAVNGIGLDQAVKGLSAQNLLPAGLDSLKKTVDRAKQLFSRNYVLTALPPPAPQVTYYVLPSTQEIVLTWPPDLESWVNPLTGAAEMDIFRIYRSDRSHIGPFTKVRDIRISRSTDRSRFFDAELGQWKYKDNTVQVGVGYYYAVTSVSTKGQESGMTNRNTKALVTARQPAENALQVSVFPNPFRLVSGLPTSGEESSIVFTNLPAKCTIRIYTVSGELVRTLEHDNPNSGEHVWDQLSDSRQKTAAGIYLYTVESAVGNAKGTLLLIK